MHDVGIEEGHGEMLIMIQMMTGRRKRMIMLEVITVVRMLTLTCEIKEAAALPWLVLSSRMWRQ